MFQPGEGFLHFVFANEDQYCLPGLLCLSRQAYIQYLLRESGFEKIVFCQGGGSLSLKGRNGESRRILSRAIPRKGWFSDLLGFSNEEPEDGVWRLSEKTCAAAIRKLFDENCDTAVVLELGALESLHAADRKLTDYFIRCRSQLAGSRNILVLTASCAAENSRRILMDPDGPFAERPDGEFLCRELNEILSGPVPRPLYESLEQYMGARVCFLNRFTPENLLPWLRRAQLHGSDLALTPRQERYLAEYLQRWYLSPEFRRASPLGLSPNPRFSFRRLAEDLERPEIRRGLGRLADSSAALPCCPRQICIHPENTVFDRLYNMQIPEEARACAGDFDRILDFFSRSWNRQWPESLAEDIRRCFHFIDEDRLRQDADVLGLICKVGLVPDEEILSTVYSYLSEDLHFREIRRSVRKGNQAGSEQKQMWEENLRHIQQMLEETGQEVCETAPAEIQNLAADEMLARDTIQSLENILNQQNSYLHILEASIAEIEGPMLTTAFNVTQLRLVDVDQIRTRVEQFSQALDTQLQQYNRITQIIQQSPLDQLSVPQRTRLQEEYSEEESLQRFREIRNRITN